MRDLHKLLGTTIGKRTVISACRKEIYGRSYILVELRCTCGQVSSPVRLEKALKTRSCLSCSCPSVRLSNEEAMVILKEYEDGEDGSKS